MRMLRRGLLRGAMLLVLAAPLLATGCVPYSPGFYPFSMGIATPIPVPAWASEQVENRLRDKNDFRTAILPPIRPGFPPPRCEDPPDEAAIMRAVRQIKRGVPYVYEEFRDDIEIVTEQIVDKIDPPRFFPLVGWAQVHHCHFKCTIFFTETRQSDWPIPFYVRKPTVEVVYIDKDHLHLWPGGTPEANRDVTRELSGY